MKKLMIAFAAVAMAACAQAVTVNWGFQWASYADGSDVGADVSIYLVDVNSYARDLAMADLDKGVFNAAKAYKAGVTGFNDEDGTYPTLAGEVATWTDDNWAKGDSKSLYTVFVTGSSKGDKYGLTDTKNVTAASLGDTTVDFGNLYDDVGGTSVFPWYTVTGPETTPEPTSAMLMLLGVAGLALRRKRA